MRRFPMPRLSILGVVSEAEVLRRRQRRALAQPRSTQNSAHEAAMCLGVLSHWRLLLSNLSPAIAKLSSLLGLLVVPICPSGLACLGPNCSSWLACCANLPFCCLLGAALLCLLCQSALLGLFGTKAALLLVAPLLLLGWRQSSQLGLLVLQICLPGFGARPSVSCLLCRPALFVWHHTAF